MLQVRYTSFWAGRSGLEQVLLVAVGLLLVLTCSCVLALVLAQQPRSCANTNIRMLHPDHPAHCGGGDTSSPAPRAAVGALIARREARRNGRLGARGAGRAQHVVGRDEGPLDVAGGLDHPLIR